MSFPNKLWIRLAVRLLWSKIRPQAVYVVRTYEVQVAAQ